MKYKTIVGSLLLTFFQLFSLCYGKQSNSRIDTQVVRILATNKSGYYHKPWKSPNFDTASASGSNPTYWWPGSLPPACQSGNWTVRHNKENLRGKKPV